jgi:hypothetical protein
MGQLSLIVAVPEPSTYALFGIGALALIVVDRRKVALALITFQRRLVSFIGALEILKGSS